jgi:uncharacterized membrane protein required for colicin V production
MSVLPTPKRQRRSSELIPSLILIILGCAGIVVLYFLVPGLRPIDLAMLFVVVGFGVVGYTQGLVRGVMTIAALYIATGIAATLYPAIAPYVASILEALGSMFSGAPTVLSDAKVSYSALALAFGLLMVVIWVTLESLGRIFFRDTSLPELGILDKLVGILIHLAIGLLAASLLFNALGYGRLRDVHDAAFLRRELNQVLYLHYETQRFWFPEEPPPIYVYDLIR